MGSDSKRLWPPPLSLQAVSPEYRPPAPVTSVVPPTDSTLGDTEGQVVPWPASPEAATNVMGVCPAGVVK